MLNLLFVGNSYTFQNDLDQRTREVLTQMAADEWTDGQTQRLAEGGYTFVAHLDRTEEAGSAWQLALADETAAWNWVVLQEQSQIPGFPSTQGEYRTSVAAAVSLDDLAEARGAGTIFLNTWGRRDGDTQNAERFPDFPTMEAHLEEGYRAYRDATSTDTRPTWVAPAGPAFARVYANVLAEGGDPTAPDSDFYRLYSADGSHPSPLGTWLVAYVLAASLTGESPVGLPTPSGLADADALVVQTAAADTVFDEALGYTYPWPTPSDTAADTAAETDTSADSAASDTPPAPAGCGCTAASSPWAPAATLMAFALSRRRRPSA